MDRFYRLLGRRYRKLAILTRMEESYGYAQLTCFGCLSADVYHVVRESKYPF